MLLLRKFVIFSVLLANQYCIAQSELESLYKSEIKNHESKLLFKKSLLTESYNIVYQRLELDIDLYKKWLIGKITTAFKPEKPAFNLLQFNLESYLTVDSVTYKKTKLQFTHLNKFVTIQLANSVPVGTIDSVSVYYSGNPGLNNPYNSFVFDKHNPSDPKPIAWTLSEPYGSMGWWPCKESLNDKIDSLDVLVKVNKGNKAASNGVLIVEKTLNDSQVLFHWRHRYPIATYLVGISVTNYISYSDYVIYPNKDSLPILNFVYPESEAEARSKTPATAKMIELFDNLFGIYPFKNEKYGHAQWNWGGGMEHQTMSFMVNYNFDLVAHELAHQWFGDFVTCASWRDLWLNEGFATYLNALCHEHLISKSDFQQRMASMRGDIVKEDNGSVYISDTASNSRLFSGRLTYKKGAYLLHMLRFKLGDQAFYAGIRNYLNHPSRRYGFGTTNALKIELEKASGQNLNEFFKDWFYGEGHPNYSISWSHIGNAIAITIKQTPSHASVSFFNMPLPVKINGTTKDTVLILDPLSAENTFTSQLKFIPKFLEFDPESWILCKASVIKVRPPAGPMMQLFPNPVDGILSIYCYTGTINEVVLFDMAGRKVLSKNLKSEGNIRDSIDLDTNLLTSGMYCVKILTDQGYSVQRIVKN